MAFSISTIIGSGLAGSMYSCIVKKYLRSSVNVAGFVLMTIFLIVLKNLALVPENKWIFMGLIALIGFIIGGAFNSLISIESSVVGQERNIPVDFVATIMMTGSCIVVGIVQLIIGISTTKSNCSIMFTSIPCICSYS